DRRLEAAEDDAHLVVGVEDVVADGDVARDDPRVLGPDLQAEVALGDHVPLDHEVAPAVDVDAAREAPAVDRAGARHAVTAAEAVPRHLARVGLDVGLAADEVDADV